MKKIIFLDGLTYSSRHQVFVGAHQYAKRFAEKGYSVCWISRPISLFHLLKKRRFIASFDRLKMAMRGYSSHENGNLIEITPFTLFPYFHNRFFPFSNSIDCIFKWTMPNLRSRLKKLGYEYVDYMWIQDPVMEPVVRTAKHNVLIYRLADLMRENPGSSKAYLEKEKIIMAKADIRLVASRPLSDALTNAGIENHCLQNGFDEEIFLDKKFVEPDEFINDNKVKGVFVGVIREWFDVELLRKIAIKFRDVNFYLIGNCSINLNNLPTNVKRLGVKPRNEIPNYLKYADFGFIFFKRSEFVDNIDPIKTYEYLACGLPIISTPMKTLNSIDLPVRIGDGIEEVHDLIRTVIRDPRKEVVDMKKYTWQRKFEEIEEILSRHQKTSN